MRYLSDYIEDKQNKLFDEMGAFFAFSKDQFNEQADLTRQYTAMGGGLICPTVNIEDMVLKFDALLNDGIAEDIADNGIPAIILRELENHEYCITFDITDTAAALTEYKDITEDMIHDVAKKIKPC